MKKIVVMLAATLMTLLFTQCSIFSKHPMSNDQMITAFYTPFKDYQTKEFNIPSFSYATCQGPIGPTHVPGEEPFIVPEQGYCPPPPASTINDDFSNQGDTVFIAIASLPSKIIEQSKKESIQLPAGFFYKETVSFTKQILLNLNGISAETRQFLNSSNFKVYAVKEGKKENELIFYLARKKAQK
jgi:hypothetical protein